MKQANNIDELQAVIDSCSKVLIKVGSKTYGPCNLVQSNLEKLETMLEQYGWTVVVIDVDEADEDFINSFGIRHIPLLLYTVDGIVVEKMGTVTCDEILRFIFKEAGDPSTEQLK